MDRFAQLTHRRYKLFDYQGAADAERVLVQMVAGVGASGEAVRALAARGEKVGLLTVRLYRPFDIEAFVAALPRSVRAISVLDRTKEPGAVGEPLYQDIVTALAEAWPQKLAPPKVIGGRYGLSSKEYTPAMAKAALDELAQAQPSAISPWAFDDVTRLSLAVTRASTPNPTTSPVRCSTAWARTAPSARQKIRSRSSARTRRSTRKATSSTTARSRARSPSRTCASAQADRIDLPDPPRATSSPATSSNSWEARRLALARRAAPSC
jgi:hypothetical protein